MTFNYKYISSGNKDKIVDEINVNFDQLLFSGVGYIGDVGPLGPTGPTGPVGKIGNVGIDGTPGSNWFRQNEPPIENINKYDYWINTSKGPTGSSNIYYYDGNEWLFTGEILSRSSIFTKLQGIIGTGNIKERDAIISSNDIDPWKETFIFSDFEFDKTNINPNYSKLKISSNRIEEPIFTLYKSNHSTNNPPSIYWKNEDPLDNGLIYRGSDDLRMISGGNLKILAGSNNPLASMNSGKIKMDIKSLLLIESSKEINFRSSGLIEPNIAALLSFNTGFKSNSNNFIIDKNISKFQRGLSVNSFNYENSEIITQQKTFPRLNLLSNLPINNSVLNTISYSTEGLYNPITGTSVILEDYRNSDQAKGEGSFKTQLVRVEQGLTKLDLGYVKNGHPGATGSYPINGVTEVIIPFSNKTINGVEYSYINLESSSNYRNKGISVLSNNIEIPQGPILGAIWIKIKTSKNKDFKGIFSRDSVISYRFYDRGNFYTVFGGTGINSNIHKFGGIIYERPDQGGDAVITFKSPVKTFEITYFGNDNKVFFKTVDDSGVINMSNELSDDDTSQSQLGAF